MEGPQGLHIHDNYMHAQYCGPPLSDSPHCVSGCPFVFMDHALVMHSRRVVYGRSPVPSHTCHTYACAMLWSPNHTIHPLCFMIVHLFSQTRHCPCINMNTFNAPRHGQGHIPFSPESVCGSVPCLLFTPTNLLPAST